MKQTAIEWFAEKDTELTIQFLEGKLNQIQLAIEKTKCLQQAKEMEKEQIIKFANKYEEYCYNIGKSNPYVQIKSAEKYYNETFKSE